MTLQHDRSSVCFTLSACVYNRRPFWPHKSWLARIVQGARRRNMKFKLYLCALLVSYSVHAELYDFNDIATGTQVNSLNPFGSAVINTRLWVTEGGGTVAESFTRGVIDNPSFLNGTPSVVIEAGPLDAPGDRSNSRWNIEIGVSFQNPISAFSVDAYSAFYSTDLIYTGVNEMGEAFTLSGGWLGGLGDRIDHFDITAPTGGYITGFYFSQFEDNGSIMLALDNLDYTLAGGAIASAPVPETIGLSTFVFSIIGMLFLHRRMKAARK